MTDSVITRLRRRFVDDVGHPSQRDEQLRAAGWSTSYVWPVPGDRGLSLRLRLPGGSVLLDIDALAAVAPDVPRWVRAAAVRPRDLSPLSGLVASRACVGRDDPGDLLFTLTILHCQLRGAPEMQVPAADPADRRLSQTVVEINDRVTVVDRLSMQSPARGAPQAPMLLVRYLLQVGLGGLSVTFETTHADMFGEQAAVLYHDIVSTIWLGAGTPPD